MAEAGRKIPDICRNLDVPEANFSIWGKKLGGISGRRTPLHQQVCLTRTMGEAHLLL